MKCRFTEELKNSKKNRQWADQSINFIRGCGNHCKYCYSCEMATRYKQVDPTEWGNEVVRQKDLVKKIKLFPKRIMFPSSHDIRPEHLKESILMLGKILSAGNEVLITSKPHLQCIETICKTFGSYKDKILFRFTIGSTDSTILRFWETNAPDFESRLACLQLAYSMGYQTSVSVEPLLDPNVDELVSTLSPFVTETIWIGKVEQFIGRITRNGFNDPETINRANEILRFQNDPSFIKHLYVTYKDNPMIKWKTSYLSELARLEQIEEDNLENPIDNC